VAELTSVEICAGAGGQALGLEQAGFTHEAVIEIDPSACNTLRLNRGSSWRVIQDDVAHISGRAFGPVDLLAGGVPCPPFSTAGKQLGEADERNLFPQALRLVEEIAPRAALLENVPGLATPRFDAYRTAVVGRLHNLGYETWWGLVQASDHGVPQLRPRFVLVAIRQPWASHFRWPEPLSGCPPTVGEALTDLMGARGWPGVSDWARRAAGIAPTIVGGSLKHGGPDLGPTRARAAWRKLGVDGLGIADDVPGPDFPVTGLPKLTNRMVARLQGFPDWWEFAGRKTASYRQVGNAFPPPVARSVGQAVAQAIRDAGPQPASCESRHHAQPERSALATPVPMCMPPPRPPAATRRHCITTPGVRSQVVLRDQGSGAREPPGQPV
jgi:DNA (cytosine-5)-methyltransferase 1